ncbi:MAG: CHAP domain-containing protein, partial [Leptolinea sp.]
MKHKIIWLLVTFLFTVLLLSPAPVSARPISDQLLLRSTDWLAGKGVDVFYPDKGPAKGEGFVEITPFCGYAYCFQCIELTVRLYAEKLGYISSNGRWPDTVSIPHNMIDVVNIAHEKQAMINQGVIPLHDAEAAKFLPFADMTFTPNGGSNPPRVGDMIIYTYRVPGDHVMVVNRIAGTKMEVVQQNIWTQNKPANPVPVRMLDLSENSGRFSINNAEGWIHSPRMKALISPTEEKQFFDSKLGGGSWRWDEDAVTITLGKTGFVGLSAASGQESAARISQQLSNSGAFTITNEPYMRCALMNAAVITSTDFRFTSNFSLKGIDIRIQYTG